MTNIVNKLTTFASLHYSCVYFFWLIFFWWGYMALYLHHYFLCKICICKKRCFSLRKR